MGGGNRWFLLGAGLAFQSADALCEIPVVFFRKRCLWLWRLASCPRIFLPNHGRKSSTSTPHNEIVPQLIIKVKKNPALGGASPYAVILLGFGPRETIAAIRLMGERLTCASCVSGFQPATGASVAELIGAAAEVKPDAIS